MLHDPKQQLQNATERHPGFYNCLPRAQKIEANVILTQVQQQQQNKMTD